MMRRALATLTLTLLALGASTLPAGAAIPPCTITHAEYREIRPGMDRAKAEVIAQCTGVFVANQDGPGYSQRVVRWRGERDRDFVIVVYRNAHVLRRAYVTPGAEG